MFVAAGLSAAKWFGLYYLYKRFKGESEDEDEDEEDSDEIDNQIQIQQQSKNIDVYFV
jgi:hypothetical protein